MFQRCSVFDAPRTNVASWAYRRAMLRKVFDVLKAGNPTAEGPRMWRDLKQAQDGSLTVKTVIADLQLSTAHAWRLLRRLFPKLRWKNLKSKRPRNVEAVQAACQQVLSQVPVDFTKWQGVLETERYQWASTIQDTFRYHTGMLESQIFMDAGTLEPDQYLAAQTGIGVAGVHYVAEEASLLKRTVRAHTRLDCMHRTYF